MLKSLNKSDAEIDSVMQLLHDKLNAKADVKGQGDLVDSLQKMSKSDQERYRSDETFRQQFDANVKSTLAGSPAAEIAQHLLDRVKSGLEPVLDLPDKILNNALFQHNADQAKADIAAAMKEDPTLPQRLQNPQSDADKQLLARLELLAAMDAPVDQSSQDWAIAKDVGKQPALSALKAASGGLFSLPDEKASLDTLQQMSAAEQKQFREDNRYQNQVIEALAKNLSDPVLLHSAQRMLEQIKNGDQPTLAPAARLRMSASQADAIHDMQKSFKEDPSLRERINNPKTEADKQFAADYKAAMYGILRPNDPSASAAGEIKFAPESDQPDLSSYGEDLLNSGRLSLKKMAALNQSANKGDVLKLADDLVNATPEERKQLVSDKAYQDKILAGLSPEQREIALAVADKGALAPEDRIRANIIGWGSSSDVANTVMSLKPNELEQAKQNYARYYHSDLENDALSKCSGQEQGQCTAHIPGSIELRRARGGAAQRGAFDAQRLRRLGHRQLFRQRHRRAN